MSKIKFVQHIPDFVSGEPAVTIEADSIDELLQSEVVQRYKSPDFYRWSWSPNQGKWSKACLLVETENGRHWWVVGYLSEIPKELPMWEGGPQDAA